MTISEIWSVEINFCKLDDYWECKECNSKKAALKWAEKMVAKLENHYTIKKILIKMELELEA
jgi:hypothetical protein